MLAEQQRGAYPAEVDPIAREEEQADQHQAGQHFVIEIASLFALARVEQLPGREPGPLVQGPGLVHPHVDFDAGSYVTEGIVTRNAEARLLRDNIVGYEGKISSLRRFKDDVSEVAQGYECGIGIENYNDIKVGDVIECYYLEEIRPEVE